MAASESGKGSTVKSIPSVDSVSPDTCVSSPSSFFFPLKALPMVPMPDTKVCLRLREPFVRWVFRARSKLVFPTFSARGGGEPCQ